MTQPVHLLFGANGGIGSALTRILAQKGCRLMLAGRNTAALEELGREVDAETAEVEATDRDAIEQTIKRVRDSFGRLDGIVNAFGTMHLKPAHLTKDEDWDQTLAVNLSSSFAITRAAARAFPKEGGSVVFISSVAARMGLPNHEAIAAAKAGLIGLALSAAATYASKGIRYNVVAPALTRTSLTRSITGNEAALQASTRMHPLGRIGEPEDIASAIAWFLDPAQSWVTGQVLGVDGGLGSVRARIGT